jgi:hypothetical protein
MEKAVDWLIRACVVAAAVIVALGGIGVAMWAGWL